MTANEIISDLAALGPQDFSVILQRLADHVYQAKLTTGKRLTDAVDCKQWLEELSVVAQARRAGLIDTTTTPPAQRRWA